MRADWAFEALKRQELNEASQSPAALDSMGKQSCFMSKFTLVETQNKEMTRIISITHLLYIISTLRPSA